MVGTVECVWQAVRAKKIARLDPIGARFAISDGETVERRDFGTSSEHGTP